MDQKKQQPLQLQPEDGILTIEPRHELKFQGPFAAPSVAVIKMTNVTPQSVHFKLKTTAPKKYFVRPNAGVVAAYETTEAKIILQPKSDGESAGEGGDEDRHKHKFMIQFVKEPPDWNDRAAEDLWESVPAADVMKYKLRCVFVDEPPQNNTDVVDSSPGLRVALDDLHRISDDVRRMRDDENDLRRDQAEMKTELAKLCDVLNTMQAERRNAEPVSLINRDFLLSLFVVLVVGFFFGKMA